MSSSRKAVQPRKLYGVERGNAHVSEWMSLPKNFLMLIVSRVVFTRDDWLSARFALLFFAPFTCFLPPRTHDSHPFGWSFSRRRVDCALKSTPSMPLVTRVPSMCYLLVIA